MFVVKFHIFLPQFTILLLVHVHVNRFTFSQSQRLNIFVRVLFIITCSVFTVINFVFLDFLTTLFDLKAILCTGKMT